MTRNEWIAARVAAAFDAVRIISNTRREAIEAADGLEADGVAPWLTPPAAPDLGALERAVVEADAALRAAVRALRAARAAP